MDILYGTITFIIVAIIYLHIVSQYKKGTDLEIYEADFIDSPTLQNTCNINQPVIFKWTSNTNSPVKFMESSKFVMQVKDTNEFYNTNSVHNPDGISLLATSLVKLLRKDAKAHYFSESNQTFIEDSGFLKTPKYIELDKILRPPNTVQTEYDILTGSQNTCVPMRYHTKTRKFMYVASGHIRVKMATWKSHEWLHEIRDFEHYDFRSPYNVWAPNNDLEEILQFLEFDVFKGYVFYIPPFWWYSIQYMESDTVIMEYNYSTFMNKIAFALDSCQYYLQQQNITTKATKRIYTNVSQICDDISDDDKHMDDAMKSRPMENIHGMTKEINTPLMEPNSFVSGAASSSIPMTNLFPDQETSLSQHLSYSAHITDRTLNQDQVASLFPENSEIDTGHK